MNRQIVQIRFLPDPANEIVYSVGEGDIHSALFPVRAHSNLQPRNHAPEAGVFGWDIADKLQDIVGIGRAKTTLTHKAI